LDEGGDIVATPEHVFENSGVVLGIAKIREGDLRFALGTGPATAGARRFRLHIEPAEADAAVTAQLVEPARGTGAPEEGNRSVEVRIEVPGAEKPEAVLLTLWRRADGPVPPRPLSALGNRPVTWRTEGVTWTPCGLTQTKPGIHVYDKLTEGGYRISALSVWPRGRYDVTPVGVTETVELTGTRTTAQATLRLEGDCSLTVRVQDQATREPLSECILLRTPDGMPIAIGESAYLRTDEQGMIGFGRLRPGQYQLEVGRRDWWYALHPEVVSIGPVDVQAGHQNEVSILSRRSNPTPDAPTEWGAAANGLQLRLKANRAAPVWAADEIPMLQVILANVSDHDLVVPDCKEACGLEFDGQWHEWRMGARRETRTLAPAEEYSHVTVPLNAYWKSRKDGTPLGLLPGKHVVRVALSAGKGADASHGLTGEGEIYAVSNPVEIEVLASEAHAFGDVVERIASDEPGGQGTFIDMDKGALLALPPELREVNAQGLYEWATEHGVDARIVPSPDTISVRLFDTFGGWQTGEAASRSWDAVTAKGLRKSLHDAMWGIARFGMLPDKEAEEQRMWNARNQTVPCHVDNLPASVQFWTRAGGMGICKS
jgi:hypothetical protein